ncbi:MAG: hypothetical protein Q6K99_07135 [Thermostichales cyanobacterium BF4_bins_65]
MSADFSARKPWESEEDHRVKNAIPDNKNGIQARTKSQSQTSSQKKKKLRNKSQCNDFGIVAY